MIREEVLTEPIFRVIEESLKETEIPQRTREWSEKVMRPYVTFHSNYNTRFIPNGLCLTALYLSFFILSFSHMYMSIFFIHYMHYNNYYLNIIMHISLQNVTFRVCIELTNQLIIMLEVIQEPWNCIYEKHVVI